MSRRYDYDQMPADEFAHWLERAGWPDGYRFARAFGFDPSRIRRCIVGKEDVSPTQGICAMLAALHPEVRDTALAWAGERSRPKAESYTRIDAGTGREKPLDDKDWPDNGAPTWDNGEHEPYGWVP